MGEVDTVGREGLQYQHDPVRFCRNAPARGGGGGGGGGGRGGGVAKLIMARAYRSQSMLTWCCFACCRLRFAKTLWQP